MNIKAASLTPEQALAELEARYEASVTALRKAIGDYIDHNTLPIPKPARKVFCLSAAVGLPGRADHKALKTRARGRFTHAGCYTTTITNPKLFRNYLLEQLTLCIRTMARISASSCRSMRSLSLRDRWFHPDTRPLDERRSDALFPYHRAVTNWR